MILTLVGTCKLRFVKRRPFGPLFDSKSRCFTFNGLKTPHARFTSRIDLFHAAKHGASSPGSSGVGPRRFPVWAVLVDLAHLAKVDSRGPKRPRRSFPSAVTHLESGSMTPSTVIRPRVVSVQVPEVADFAFCPIVGHATAVAYNKIW